MAIKIGKFRSESLSNAIKMAKAYQRSHAKNLANIGQTNAVSKTGRTFGKPGWREIAGKRYYFRSRWEANYARYLEFLKENNKIKDWFYEPTTFWFLEIKRGVRSYLPDFLVVEEEISSKLIACISKRYYVEVKGYYDSKSLTKIKRFRKYYPQEELRLIDKEWFSKNTKKLKGFIHNWE